MNEPRRLAQETDVSRFGNEGDSLSRLVAHQRDGGRAGERYTTAGGGDDAGRWNKFHLRERKINDLLGKQDKILQELDQLRKGGNHASLNFPCLVGEQNTSEAAEHEI